MMVDIVIEGKTYKVRAGASMPIGYAGHGDFVMHTFNVRLI